MEIQSIVGRAKSKVISDLRCRKSFAESVESSGLGRLPAEAFIPTSFWKKKKKKTWEMKINSVRQSITIMTEDTELGDESNGELLHLHREQAAR